MFEAIFMSHPRTMGESYGRHLRHAFGYAFALLAAGAAAAVHGLVPCLFERTASQAICRLHARMGQRLPMN